MSRERHILYLIRHGLTLQNLQREYQGSVLDYGILPESRLLIEQRQKRGVTPEIRTLWVSPLLRARQTAELYFPGMDMELMPDLMEREFGDWDGRTHDELLLSDPLYPKFLDTFRRLTPPGGEAYDLFIERLDRIMDAVQTLADQAPGSFPLALVFHGGPILHLTDRLLPEAHPLYRYFTKGGGGLRLVFETGPLRVLEASELFTDDVPVEKTPFYLDFKSGPDAQ
ncbi:MAG TPA: histidine phosphatase family protein [Bacillota bacterium]|nr:histidine phosphatase family protein [Fastidiosipila sp.]HPX93709.1 histidine phosphatase family protein [Bacillota bacterium]HQB81457.1 histidine phosphatase family protein [Bacillota bacterium]